MARLNNGLLGGFTGVLGTIEGYMLNGQQICRSRRVKSTKPPSVKQLACRQKMRMAKSFVGAFIDFAKVGFAYTAVGKTHSAYNAAVGWQIKNAITGVYPYFTIDYARVRVTEGPLDIKDIHATASMTGNKLIFIWAPDYSYLHANDHVMILAYAPALNEAVYNLCGEKRSKGTDQLMLPVDLWGRDVVVETYISFITEHEMQGTNSIYTGSHVCSGY